MFVVCPECGCPMDWDDFIFRSHSSNGAREHRSFMCQDCKCCFNYCASVPVEAERERKKHNYVQVERQDQIAPFGSYGHSVRFRTEEEANRLQSRPLAERTFRIRYGKNPIGISEESLDLNTIDNFPYEEVVKLYPEAKDMKLGENRVVVLGNTVVDPYDITKRDHPSLYITRSTNAKPKRRIIGRR